MISLYPNRRIISPINDHSWNKISSEYHQVREYYFDASNHSKTNKLQQFLNNNKSTMANLGIMSPCKYSSYSYSFKVQLVSKTTHLLWVNINGKLSVFPFCGLTPKINGVPFLWVNIENKLSVFPFCGLTPKINGVPFLWVNNKNKWCSLSVS